MQNCYNLSMKNAIPISMVVEKEFTEWYSQQPKTLQNWLQNTKFIAKPNTYRYVSDDQGSLVRVVVGVNCKNDFWCLAGLPTQLPSTNFYIDDNLSQQHLENIAIAWGLGAYQFSRYKTRDTQLAQLVIPDAISKKVSSIVAAIYLVRDLINATPDDMTPADLAKAVRGVAQDYNANVTEIIGEDLLKANYPMVYHVGRASIIPPRFIELNWGDKNNPQICLVGKGVCFDTGGLNIKPSSNMLLMKKDMGGAAHALALAQLIMQHRLAVNLRLLIPAVDNAISGNAIRPSEVIRTRANKTVEITNTDAEGRLILADALFEGCQQHPDLIIDFATLTGAGRVALGLDVPAMFCNDDKLADALIQQGKQSYDPIWQLPLFHPYREMLNSQIADLINSSLSPYAGAITAALFLEEFIDKQIPWVHFDLMAWNTHSRPGRPEGGEALAIRTVFEYLCKQYPKN